jgi:hypothetical protein
MVLLVDQHNPPKKFPATGFRHSVDMRTEIEVHPALTGYDQPTTDHVRSLFNSEDKMGDHDFRITASQSSVQVLDCHLGVSCLHSNR